MLPFFKAEYDLSYTAAAAIVFATNSASAIVQPLFGFAADKFSKGWLLPISLLMAGFGIGLSGIAGSYIAILLLVMFSGIGIAAFHPQTARLINFAAGEKKGTAMSFFGLGGTLGFALGPLLTTAMLTALGLSGSLILIFPVSVAALIIAFQLPRLSHLETTYIRANGNGVKDNGPDRWAAFSLLSIVIMGRSVIFFGLLTFVPLYWIGHYNRSVTEGGFALTTLLLSGVIGNFFGGWISDRIGRKKTTIMSFFVLALMLPLFISTSNHIIGFLLLIPIGFTHSATYSPSIVMGQEYLPNHVGFSSGVTLGLAVAFGGIAAPFIGKIADLYSIWHAMMTLAAFPLLNLLLSIFLPRIKTPASPKSIGSS
jgi:FSR family fosmidomycin resistance protein-like MFS transporter